MTIAGTAVKALEVAARIARATHKTRSLAYARLDWRVRRAGPQQRAQFRFPFGSLSLVDLKSMGSQYYEIFVDEVYGADLPPNPCIVDCGANVGLATIWFKQKFTGAHVTAVEADPNVFAILERNVHAQRLADVTMIHGALAKTAGTVRFHADGGMGGHVHPSGEIVVPALRLSSILPDDVDLLKLDIEGSEFAVIDELVDSGAIFKVRRLVCEIHAGSDQTQLVARFLNQLATTGFLTSIRWAEPFREPAKGASPFQFFSGKSARYVLHAYAWRGDGS